MPRLKPTTTLDVVGTLDINPEKGIEDYFESKRGTQNILKAPNWDSAGDSIQLLFIRNGREFESMQGLQKELFEQQKLQRKINYSRLAITSGFQANLRKRYIGVNNFVRDCAEKKKSALKKGNEEFLKHESLRDSIEKYAHSIDGLKAFRSELKKTVNEYEPYERVLEEVVKQTDMFDSVQDCIDRCDAIMLSQIEIRKLDEEKLHEIEEVRKHMVKVTNEAAATVLGLKNELVQLERSYAMAQMEALKWQKILARAKDQYADCDTNHGRAVDSIQQMYRLLCKRRGKTGIRRNIRLQLDFIKDEVELLREVVQECDYMQEV